MRWHKSEMQSNVDTTVGQRSMVVVGAKERSEQEMRQTSTRADDDQSSKRIKSHGSKNTDTKDPNRQKVDRFEARSSVAHGNESSDGTRTDWVR